MMPTGPGAPPMIETAGLSKTYGNVRALRDVTLSVTAGEVYGLLGPNGSGKTTLLRILLGFLRASHGRARVDGLEVWADCDSVRERASFLPGELRLYGGMTGLQTLRFLSDLRGGGPLERAVAIAEGVMKLDLSRRLRTYSTGMKQKLAVAQAFADPVKLLVLDEPTSALDPSARNDVLGLVAAAKGLGQTVVFSGHVLSEVEQVCDRVAILRRGRLMHVEDLHDRRALRMVLVRFAGGEEPEWLDELALTVRDRSDGNVLLEHQGEIGPLLAWLSVQELEGVAIGTEDLRSLYDRFHGPKAVLDDEGE